MVVLPVVKLGTLALRTSCKPIANRLKKEAGIHPKFRHFIITIAQANHRFTTRLQRRIYAQATDVAIRPLNEDKAVQAAADLIGELFVFTVTHTNTELLSSLRCKEVLDQKRERKNYGDRRYRLSFSLPAIKTSNEELAAEVQLLQQKLQELEQLARGRGLAGVINFRQNHAGEDRKLKPN